MNMRCCWLPLKYPVMFRSCQVVVVNKIDLLPHLDFDMDRFLDNLNDINPQAAVIQLSARTGQGVDHWCTWLLDTLERAPQIAATDAAHTHEHHHDDLVHTHEHRHDTEHDHDH